MLEHCTMKLPDAYSPAVMSMLARQSVTPLPDVSPQWHLIQVYEGAERKVAGALVARRFGIYIPESEETVIVRGRAVDRTALLFPGYIFVFVWNVFHCLDPIESIDGVIRVVLDVNGAPLPLKDAEIDHIRRIENRQRPIRLEQFEIEVDAPPRKTKKKKRARQQTRRVKVRVSDEVVRTRTGGWSRGDFDDILDDGLKTLDSPQRNQTLLRALGLG
jgi:transcription antitermination factor NusG